MNHHMCVAMFHLPEASQDRSVISSEIQHFKINLYCFVHEK